MSLTTPALDQAEDSLRELENLIGSVQRVWPVTSAETNGPANEGLSPKPQPQPISDIMDILRRCENLPAQALLVVESAWELLEADKLPDWDDFGKYVLDLLTKQAAAIAETASLVQRGQSSAIPLQATGTLRKLHSSVAVRTRDFLDSWPWSTGNKPGDEEGAAAARMALKALPSFEELSRLAERFPPPPEWWNGE
jgi:hypothetical protein